MSKPLSNRTKAILAKWLCDIPNDERRDVVWNCDGAQCVKHKYVELMAVKAKISIDSLEPLYASPGNVAVLLRASMQGPGGERSEITTGEANVSTNCKSPYPWAMAEKRAKDRAILKLLDLHGDLYSDAEIDSFSSPSDQGSPGATASQDGSIGRTDAAAVVAAAGLPIKKGSEIEPPGPKQEALSKFVDWGEKRTAGSVNALCAAVAESTSGMIYNGNPDQLTDSDWKQVGRWIEFFKNNNCTFEEACRG